MPELPEVETQRRYLEAHGLHRSINAIHVLSRDMLEATSPQQLAANLVRHQLTGTRRHGKYLFARLSRGAGWLVFHFGMTGFLKYYAAREGEPLYARVTITFTGSRNLAYVSQRKLGLVRLIDDVDRFIDQRQLGPDAMDPAFRQQDFIEAIAGGRATIKSTLMNQQTMAGVGNDYSDEILYQCGIHPAVKTCELGQADLARVYRTMRRVLRTAVDRGADPSRFPRSYMIPHRHGDGRCPGGRCDLESIKISGRTAFYCPERQGSG